MAKTYILAVLILFFSFIAGFALLHPGLPPTHDGEYHVIRFYEFDKTLRDGNFYPRWAPDLNFGFGVPLFNYVYPFPNYVSSLFHLFGASFIDAFKMNMFLAIIAGGIFFFFWTRIFWGDLGAFVSAIFYTFSPYHFVDIYIRGSVGEVWALAWYPAFLWSATMLIFTKKNKYLPLSSVFLGLIIFSHNILALAFFPFALIYTLVILLTSDYRLKSLIFVSVSFLLGLGLSAIFWFPALLETKYVTGLQIFGLERNFPDLYQLIIPSWGSEFFGTGGGNEMSVQIGIMNLIIFLLGFFVLWKLITKKSRKAIITVFFLFTFILIFFLMLKVSLPVWQNLPLLHYFQFPWRLLSLEILVCSFLTGEIVYIRESFFITMIIIFLLLLTTIAYDKPAHYLMRTDDYYISRSNFIDGTNSPGNVFGTMWMSGKKERAIKKISILSGKGILDIKEIKSTRYAFQTKLIADSEILINTAFFPGWTAYMDGREIKIKRNEDGGMKVVIPKGQHSLLVVLLNTKVQQIAFICSLISFILVLTLFVKNWYSYTVKIHEHSV